MTGTVVQSLIPNQPKFGSRNQNRQLDAQQRRSFGENVRCAPCH